MKPYRIIARAGRVSTPAAGCPSFAREGPALNARCERWVFRSAFVGALLAGPSSLQSHRPIASRPPQCYIFHKVHHEQIWTHRLSHHRPNRRRPPRRTQRHSHAIIRLWFYNPYKVDICALDSRLLGSLRSYGAATQIWRLALSFEGSGEAVGRQLRRF